MGIVDFTVFLGIHHSPCDKQISHSGLYKNIPETSRSPSCGQFPSGSTLFTGLFPQYANKLRDDELLPTKRR